VLRKALADDVVVFIWLRREPVLGGMKAGCLKRLPVGKFRRQENHPGRQVLLPHISGRLQTILLPHANAQDENIRAVLTDRLKSLRTVRRAER
jgi:hypothetical protein